MRLIFLLLLSPSLSLLPSPTLAATLSVAVSGGDFSTIQSAIASAQNGDVIQVAPGTWHEDLDFLGKDIEVVGTGCAAETFLVGSGTGPVVRFVTAEGPGAILRGFDISGGNATADSQHGGGIDVYLASPTLTDLVIHDNAAVVGAGLLVNQGNPVVDRCVFQANVADGGAGGGFYVYLSSGQFQDLRVEGNSAQQGGGAFVWGGAPSISESAFIDNLASFGAGLRLDQGTSAVVDGVLFEGNQAEIAGGVYIAFSTPSLNNVVIQENAATEEAGGIKWVGDTAAGSLTNSTVSSNTSGYAGGGLLIDDGASPTIQFTEISNNFAVYGGGMLAQVCSIQLSRSTLYQNTATSGAGVYALSAQVEITANRFANNIADAAQGNGGGLIVEESTGAVTNNLFLDNSAYSGGGLYLRALSGGADIHNNSFAANRSTGSAGGIRISSATADIRNNIVAFGPEGSGISAAADHTSTLAYNDVFSNPDGAYSGGMTDPTGSNGNAAVDPGFLAFSSDGDGLADDLQLEAGSAAIGAGDPSPAFNDADGSSNDMGAHGGPLSSSWEGTPPPQDDIEVTPPQEGDCVTVGDDDDDDDTSGDDDDDNTGDDDDDDDASADDDDDDSGDDDDAPSGCDCDSLPESGAHRFSPLLLLSLLIRRRRS